MEANIIKDRQINVAHLSKVMATTINSQMGFNHHHEVHQRRQGQALALLVFPVVPKRALMVFLVDHRQMEGLQGPALCPCKHHRLLKA